MDEGKILQSEFKGISEDLHTSKSAVEKQLEQLQELKKKLNKSLPK